MAADAPHKRCPKCQTSTPLDTRFCRQCGHPFRTQFPPDDRTQMFHGPPTAAAPAPRLPAWAIPALAGVLLLAGSGWWAAWSVRSASREKSTPSLPAAEFRAVVPAEPPAAGPPPALVARPVDLQPTPAPAPPASARPPAQPLTAPRSFSPPSSGTTPPAAAPGPAAANNAEPRPVPPALVTYMGWLQEIDAQRAGLAAAAAAEGPLAMEQTPGRGWHSAAAAAQRYGSWGEGLQALQQRVYRLDGLGRQQGQPGGQSLPRVPAECAALHQLYAAALRAQAQSAREIAAALVAGDARRFQQQMAASGRGQDLLRRADAEIATLALRYGTQPWFRIAVVPAQTPPSPR